MERHSNPLMECLAHIIAALCKKFGSGKSGIGRKCNLTPDAQCWKIVIMQENYIFCPYSIHIIQANLMNTKTLMRVCGKHRERLEELARFCGLRIFGYYIGVVGKHYIKQQILNFKLTDNVTW